MTALVVVVVVVLVLVAYAWLHEECPHCHHNMIKGADRCAKCGKDVSR